MPALVDTSVLIDHLRGVPEAVALLADEREKGRAQASEITRLEVLAGMRPREEGATTELLSTLAWHGMDQRIAEEAGRLGRLWLPSHQGVDAADLVIAATATLLSLRLLTLNVKHFPMLPGLVRPY